MNAIIDAAFSRRITVLMVFAFTLIIGVYAYLAIPKEASPSVPIPTVMVSVALDGISPEDAEDQLVVPLETEFGNLVGLRQMSSTASDGSASVMLEFSPGFDASAALTAIREGATRAHSAMPDSTSLPVVEEENTSLFPIVTVMLYGAVPERTLIDIAREAERRLEALGGVLRVTVTGARREIVEVLIDPATLRAHNLSLDTLLSQVAVNNQLIRVGALETPSGRLALNIPGVIDDVETLRQVPIQVSDDTVLTFADLAQVRRTFEQPNGFARIDGQPAIGLEIQKRIGANIVETVAQARLVIDELSKEWPETVQTRFLQDESVQIRTLLSDLENNVISAVILVMLVILGFLGFRQSILVGLAIPGAFLAGVAILWSAGFTMNIVVLFSLILVVGMLVDGAIVSVELAEAALEKGADPGEAFAGAAKRMAWPILSSTLTTLAVFFPLLFWTGEIGQFMKFLPITVIATLSISVVMALIFIPVLGSVISGRRPASAASARGDNTYVRLLRRTVQYPLTTLACSAAILLTAFSSYVVYGTGLQFFPAIEPDFGAIQIRSRDNLSVFQRDVLVRDVEARLLDMEELASLYASTGSADDESDLIGTVQLEFLAWNERRPAADIMKEARLRLADIAGIDIQIQEEEQGPVDGKPIIIEISGSEGMLGQGVATVRAHLASISGVVDIIDDGSVPGVEWQLLPDRTAAARFGVSAPDIGQAVQLLSSGITVAQFLPPDAARPVDIVLRAPEAYRSLEAIEALRLTGASGQVPLSNFIAVNPVPKVASVQRLDGKRVIRVSAGILPGLSEDEILTRIEAELSTLPFPEGVTAGLSGAAEEQDEAEAFLLLAFVGAIFLMFVVLVTQFNSLFQALLVLSAIIFSIAGVLFGLLVTGRPFDVVMSGIGCIALAGIVVNNNIVLIDTYNALKAEGRKAIDAVLETGRQRFRPIMLTSITTVLGLMPMVLGATVDIPGQSITFGAPSTQWWTELSSAIAGGIVVATAFTLFVTPALLVLIDRRREASA